MQVFEGFETVKALKNAQKGGLPWSKPVIAMGNFDGVHLGHQVILKDAIEAARRVQGTSICLTFQPHPSKILSPQNSPKMIQTFEQKRDVIASLGMEVLLVQKFDLEFSKLEYDVFFEQYLKNLLEPSALRVGCRFAFGHYRQGNEKKLKALCEKAGIDFQALAEFRLDDELISSSRIRQLLERGKLNQVNQLLGRNYRLIGKVESGAGRGKKIGFPTANIDVKNEMLLPRGVYACRGFLAGNSQSIPGVANLGIRPTFDDQKPRQDILEIHLFDFEKDIYDQKIELEMIAFLREEKKFESIDSLRQQIKKDCEKARAVLLA